MKDSNSNKKNNNNNNDNNSNNSNNKNSNSKSKNSGIKHKTVATGKQAGVGHRNMYPNSNKSIATGAKQRQGNNSVKGLDGGLFQ